VGGGGWFLLGFCRFLMFGGGEFVVRVWRIVWVGWFWGREFLGECKFAGFGDLFCAGGGFCIPNLRAMKRAQDGAPGAVGFALKGKQLYNLSNPWAIGLSGNPFTRLIPHYDRNSCS
jgi:hypothetical protein